MRRRRSRVITGLLLAGVLGGTACSSGGAAETAPAATGQTLTMWTRGATEVQTRRFIEAYNSLGRNTVELQVIPNDTYLQYVATAAGGRNLPDLLGADVVYTPNFIEQGFFADIGDRVRALDHVDALAPSHVDVATADDQIFAVPHTLDLSVLFYNKVLYRQAGLDPESPPTSVTEMAEHAAKIQQLGNGVSGSYFTGSCAGCVLFTAWPSVWADGGEVLNADGTASELDKPAMAAVLTAYRQMIEAGSVPPGAEQENGTTWLSVFNEGKIGVLTMPSTFASQVTQGPALELGVAAIPGLNGGESTFVGGDVAAISATSTKADAAWDFLSWTLSEEAQLKVLGANADAMARTDLGDRPAVADNEVLQLYSRIIPKGRTPKSVNFGATFNDPQGPWLSMMHEAVYGPQGVQAALDTYDPQLDASLAGGS